MIIKRVSVKRVSVLLSGHVLEPLDVSTRVHKNSGAVLQHLPSQAPDRGWDWLKWFENI